MLIHEKCATFCIQVVPDPDVSDSSHKSNVEDFTLGPFDDERLGETPPESDWSDWFPPPPRMTDWELDELTDRVEVESAKNNLNPGPDSYPPDNFLRTRRNMIPEMIHLAIPVPPAPVLERAVGYQNIRNARFLALWWEPAGDEAMVSDGFATFTGDWPGYLAYVQHKAVYQHLVSYNLGSSDEPAEYHLVINLLERKAYMARSRDAEMVLAH